MDNYQTLQPIGRGAYGFVYLYRRLSDNKAVVIKKIPLESISRAECELTKNEVRVLSMLQHPNIIEYYDNYLEHSTMMIVMEYAPGGNLYDYLRSRGEGNLLQEEDVLHLFCQLVFGMQHIHESNILHRDIKSNNILLDRTHRIVKIGDFGISKILSSKSKAHTVVGTPCYLSPELCQEKPYNQKSDIWALGCVLYEMLTLRRAFEAETLPALIMKIMRGIIAPIHPHYSAEMRALVHLLLHMDPAQRPNIHQVLSHPLVFPTLFRLQMDLGMVRCASRPLRLSSVGSQRTRSSRGSEASTVSTAELERMRTPLAPPTPLEDPRHLTEKQHQQPLPSSSPFPPGSSSQESSVFICTPGTSPVRVCSSGGDAGGVVRVAVSDSHCLGVTSLGHVLRWDPQTTPGNPTTPKEEEGVDCDNDDFGGRPFTTTRVRLPPPLTATAVLQVACGDGFMACVTEQGALLTSGRGSQGALGHGGTGDEGALRLVEALGGVKEVACGSSHILALTLDGRVYAWGCGANGRLGVASRMTQLRPQQVPLENPAWRVKGLAAGDDCSFLITQSGLLLATGSNRHNKLGVDETDVAGCETLKQIEDVATFVPVCSLPLAAAPLLQAAPGPTHTLFLTENGEVYSAGLNSSGQLGHCSSQNPRVPARVSGHLARARVTQVAAGRHFSMALTQDGCVYWWGSANESAKEVAAVPTQLDLPHALPKGARVSVAAGGTCLILCHHRA